MTKSDKPIRIILADDHELFRDGFKVMLKKQPSVQLVAEASNGNELLELTRALHPDVVVTDIKMPVMDGIEAAKKLSEEMPATGVIALSMFDEENLIVEMMEAGARGYLLKNAHKDEIMEAIRTVNSGDTYYCNHTSAKLAQLIAKSNFHPRNRAAKPQLNEKETEVIRLICEQLTNKEIAERINLSIRTVEGYRDRIQEKIGAKNMAGIVVFAIKNDIYKLN